MLFSLLYRHPLRVVLQLYVGRKPLLAGLHAEMERGASRHSARRSGIVSLSQSMDDVHADMFAAWDGDSHNFVAASVRPNMFVAPQIGN